MTTISINFIHTVTHLFASLLNYLKSKGYCCCTRVATVIKATKQKYLKKKGGAKKKKKKAKKGGIGISQEDVTENRGDEESGVAGDAGVVAVKEINVKTKKKQKKGSKKEGPKKKKYKKKRINHALDADLNV